MTPAFIPPPPPDPAWLEWLETLRGAIASMPPVRTVVVSQSIFDRICEKVEPEPAPSSPLPFYGRQDALRVNQHLGRDQWFAIEGKHIVSINGQELTKPIELSMGLPLLLPCPGGGLHPFESEG